MSRLIDEILDEFKDINYAYNDCSKFDTLKRMLNDAVKVVRCKDCKWGREVCGNIECFVDMNVPSEYHGYEWFCPNGERKEQEDETRENME